MIANFPAIGETIYQFTEIVDFFKVLFNIFDHQNFCRLLFVICVDLYQVPFALSFPSWQLSQSSSGRAVFITD